MQQYPIAIIGMEDTGEFTAVFVEGKRDIDVEKCRQEMVATAVWHEGLKFRQTSIIFTKGDVLFYARSLSFDEGYRGRGKNR
jgi:hypothetical protein